MNYSNENKGVLYINERKEKETQPDFKGSINVNGIDFWISGWKRKTEKGQLISMVIDPKIKIETTTDPEPFDLF